LKAGWSETTIGAIARIARGGSPRPIQKYLTKNPDGINWIKIGDATKSGKYIFETEEKIIPAGVARSRLVTDGDFLLSNSMSFGRPYILKTTGCIHDGWLVLTPDLKRVYQDFLYHLLGAPQVYAQFDRLAAGSTVRNLNTSLVSTVRIPLPPLDEQKRIVAVLDEAFEGLSRARANAEANLADAQVLALNHLRNLFAECAQLHPFRRIGDVADHCLGKMLDKNKNQGTLRPYLRNINVRWFEVDTSDMLEMRIEDREVERYSAKKGDLLICEGGYPGRAAVWDKEETGFFQKALHRVRFSNPAYATFLMYFLFMKDATGQLKEHFTGSGIQHFTGQALAQFQMPFPDLGTVGKIVSQIEEVDATTSALERHYQVTISQLDALRQSLLQRAFSGGLT
jgi:type I restriction enzyme, S subunit